MRRREFTGSALAGLAALAGCTGDGKKSEKEKEATKTIDVHPKDANPKNAVTTLKVRFRAGIRQLLDPSDTPAKQPEKAQIFVVFQLEIKNTGDAAATIKPGMFQLGYKGDAYNYQNFKDSDQIHKTTLKPGESLSGWLVINAHMAIGNPSLVVSQKVLPEPVAVNFKEDEDMEFSSDLLVDE